MSPSLLNDEGKRKKGGGVSIEGGRTCECRGDEERLRGVWGGVENYSSIASAAEMLMLIV